MLRFLKNFTEDLNRRFNTTALDVAPSEFDTQKVLITADIETPYVEKISVTFRVTLDSIASGTTESVSYVLAASDNNTLLSSAIYNLKDLASITLHSVATAVFVDRGIGGSGNYTLSTRVKMAGNTIAPSSVLNVYQADTTFAVGGGATAWHDQKNLNWVIYHGNRVFAAGNNPAGATPRPPQIIVPQIIITVPGTAANVDITDFYSVFTFTIEYNKQPRDFTDRSVSFV